MKYEFIGKEQTYAKLGDVQRIKFITHKSGLIIANFGVSMVSYSSIGAFEKAWKKL